ncbi:MAG: hypothetical protein ACE5KF_04600 [Kiloniellaceae bacterium]
MAFLVMAVSAGDLATAAEPLPDPPSNFDWRDLIEDSGDGDHVVGEEMCARPAWRADSRPAQVTTAQAPATPRGAAAHADKLDLTAT